MVQPTTIAWKARPTTSKMKRSWRTWLRTPKLMMRRTIERTMTRTLGRIPKIWSELRALRRRTGAEMMLTWATQLVSKQIHQTRSRRTGQPLSRQGLFIDLSFRLQFPISCAMCSGSLRSHRVRSSQCNNIQNLRRNRILGKIRWASCFPGRIARKLVKSFRRDARFMLVHPALLACRVPLRKEEKSCCEFQSGGRWKDPCSGFSMCHKLGLAVVE